jgi:dTDP-D-glucose 4,6-dehydratase
MSFTNLEIVKHFLKISNKDNRIKYVENRKGQDIAYKINDSKIRELGWSPKINIYDEAINIYNNFDTKRFITKP